ncbi:MAG TPA: B12-binding domain-containing radical SAM protein [Deltaproteobacteria bacterium]|nr:B12-binding domain-containing radical SAM protein [Deltaproteobacteria bacterium]
MKLTLISPPFGEAVRSSRLMSMTGLDEIQKSEGLPIAPPVLEYLAGLTGKVAPHVEVELVDANRQDLDVSALDADVVGFTVLTPQAPWVYRRADELRSMGRKVVLGGMHVTVLPREAAAHADAVIIGEAESCWGECLSDAEAGRLKPFYRGVRAGLEDLARPRRGLLATRYPMGSFFTARGCPFKCAYCSVYRFFGNAIRHRPIEDVVAEVAESPYWMFWNVDDNIWGAGMDRSIRLYTELYRELSGMRKWWIGSGDLVSPQHSRGRELLKWARRSGLTLVMVGWETENAASLAEWNALLKQGGRRREAVRMIRDHGIDVMLFIMVGGRRDTPDDFKRALDISDELGCMIHPMMVTPFPGTDLYELYRPYLIAGRGWEYYNGNRAVFEHDDPAMSVENREKALFWLRAEAFSASRIMGRLWELGPRGFPMTHVTSAMIQVPMGRAFREIREGNPYVQGS